MSASLQVDRKRLALLIGGLTDEARRRSVRSALQAIPGVFSVDLEDATSSAVVAFDPTRVVPHQFRLATRCVGCTVLSMLLHCPPALA